MKKKCELLHLVTRVLITKSLILLLDWQFQGTGKCQESGQDYRWVKYA